MAGRRIRRQIGGLQEGVATEILVQAVVVGTAEKALVERGQVRRLIPGQQMN